MNIINHYEQKEKTIEQKIIVNITEVSSYLDVSVSEIRKLVRFGEIPYFRVGNRIKFDLKQINAWIEESEKNEKRKYNLWLE